MECIWVLVGLDVVWFHIIYSAGRKDNCGKEIISDCLSWVRIEFIVYERVG